MRKKFKRNGYHCCEIVNDICIRHLKKENAMMENKS